MAKHAGGRPPTGKYDIKTMIAAVDYYVEKSPYPILKELCLKQGWDYDYVCDISSKDTELSKSIKRLHAKREVVLEQGVMVGKFPVPFVIFRLKQPVHGWTDKPPEDKSSITINYIPEIAGLINNPAPNRAVE